MATMAVTVERRFPQRRLPPPAHRPAPEGSLPLWLRAQRVSLRRHSHGLGPFPEGTFGRGAAAPARAHLTSVNDFVHGMQRELDLGAAELARLGASAEQDDAALARLLTVRARTGRLVDATEKVWDFYFRIFSQRQTRLGPMLLAADRIALDCYQVTFLGLGAARSIPSPPPFSYMHGDQGAATFRRGVSVSLLGHQANPFPLVKLPYHRMLSCWTLGAIPHEVAHNLQSDLGLWHVVPRRVAAALEQIDVPPPVAGTWVRWHKEVFADLLGVLLAGPAYVTSLTEVVSRDRTRVRRWSGSAVHPTPFLRPLISLVLLERLGFRAEADVLRRTWFRLYPAGQGSSGGEDIPAAFSRSFPRCAAAVVELMCFTPYPELGGRALWQVVPFGKKELALVREAAERLARGIDPGVVPERFLVGASRVALEERLAPPGRINKNFYQALVRR